MRWADANIQIVTCYVELEYWSIRESIMTLSLSPCSASVMLQNMTIDSNPVADAHAAHLAVLVQRIAGGCAASLGLLYEQTLARVHGLALRITQRRDLAEEVCVETYWQVWREAVHFDAGRGHPLAWLMMMTRSRALDALRRLDPAATCANPEIHLDGEHHADDSALDLLLDAECDGALKQALETLTPIQRQIIALALYKDLSHQDISEHTGLPLGTVKSHLKRAQDSLRAVLCKSEGSPS